MIQPHIFSSLQNGKYTFAVIQFIVVPIWIIINPLLATFLDQYAFAVVLTYEETMASRIVHTLVVTFSDREVVLISC